MKYTLFVIFLKKATKFEIVVFCKLKVALYAFSSSADIFFKIDIFEKFFHEYH